MKGNSIARLALMLCGLLLALAPWCRTAAAATDAEVAAKLGRTLPELRMDGVGFADVLDFMKDVSGVTIEADWAAVEKAGVHRNAPVTIIAKEMKFSDVLTSVLDKASGVPGKLVYTVKKGVIHVAPKA